jgi:hypothetical protein
MTAIEAMNPANQELFQVTSRRSTKALETVVHSFSSVSDGQRINTAQLLDACRSHLQLIQSGGAALALVAKDLDQNLLKAEAFYRTRPKDCFDLASLLEIEQMSGVHNGNKLGETSAAMGLLWIRRSLSFQMELYSSIIESDRDGKSPSDAALDSYSKHLLPFHGWVLQKIFPVSLSQMPERKVLLSTLGGVALQDLNQECERMILEKLSELVFMWGPLIGAWKEEFERLGLEDTRRV